MGTAMNLFLVWVAAFSIATTATAQDAVKVSATVSSERAYVGDPITLEIVVDGSTDARAPDLSGLDGFQAEYLGDENRSMTSMSIVNGRRSQSETIEYVFRYALTPLRAGTLQIAPVPVQVDGKAFETQPVWVAVRAAQSSEDYILKVEADKQRLYIGEPVMLTFTWYISTPCTGGRFSGPESGGAYELSSPPDPRASKPGVDPRRFVDFTFLGVSAVGERGEGRIGGRAFQTLRFSQVLIPRRTGSLTFGPINLAFDQVTGQSRDIFDRRPQTSRMVIASDPLNFEVLELPTDGRPADFYGLVGDYSIATSATPTAASVGDPIALTVRVRGPEPLPGLEPPELLVQDGFAGDFKLASEGWNTAPSSPPEERGFTTVIRATRDEVSQVPPIELCYFDPATSQYRHARSAPIPLAIAPTREVTVADAIVAQGAESAPGGGPRLAAIERLPLESGPAGIVEGDRGVGLLVVQQPDALGWVSSPVGVVVLAAPVLVFLVSSVWGPTRRALTTPRRRALARAERAIRRAASSDRPAEAIGAAVRNYLGPLSNMPPEAMTARDCTAALALKSLDAGATIAALLDECDGNRYGGRRIDAATLGARTIDALRQLDKEVREAA